MQQVTIHNCGSRENEARNDTSLLLNLSATSFSRRLTDKLSIQSNWSQKTFDRAGKELSNRMQQVIFNEFCSRVKRCSMWPPRWRPINLMNCVHYAPKSAHTCVVTEARRAQYGAIIINTLRSNICRLSKSSVKYSPAWGVESINRCRLTNQSSRRSTIPFNCHLLSPAEMALWGSRWSAWTNTHRLKVAVIRLNVSRWAGPDVPSDNSGQKNVEIRWIWVEII